MKGIKIFLKIIAIIIVIGILPLVIMFLWGIDKIKDNLK